MNIKNVIASGLGIFVLGFILKFFHTPLNGVLMLCGLFLILGAYSRAIFIKSMNLLEILVGLTAWAWLVLLFFAIKFFPYSKIPFALSLVLSLLSASYALRKKQLASLRLALMPMLLALVCWTTPSDSRYYLFNLKWSVERNYDFSSWDKYSWFLYQHKNYQEATWASEKALEIAENSQHAEVWKSRIQQHQHYIKTRTWSVYSQSHN